MRTFDELCKFFQDIASDPAKIVSGLTIREYLEIEAHLQQCDACNELVDQILDNAPQDPPKIVKGFTNLN